MERACLLTEALAGALLSALAHRLLAEPRPDPRGVSRVVVATALAVE